MKPINEEVTTSVSVIALEWLGPSSNVIAAPFSRYTDCPGAGDIKDELGKYRRLWWLSRDELNALTREIRALDWRPGQQLEAWPAVGELCWLWDGR